MGNGEYFRQNGLGDISGFGTGTEGFSRFRILRQAPGPEETDRHQAQDQFLRSLGIGKPFIQRWRAQADAHGTTIEEELLADPGIDEAAYYGALARLLGLPFLDRIDPEHVHLWPAMDGQLIRPKAIRLDPPDRAPILAITPSADTVATELERLARSPALRNRMAVTTPSMLRAAVWQADEKRRVLETSTELFETQPELSARVVFWGSQGFWAGISLSALAAFLVVAPAETLFAFHVALTFAFFVLIALRFSAIQNGPRLAKPQRLAAIADFPVYTVMVALYQEVEIVPQLVSRLDRLNWPRSRLDIKLVCEADDHPTIAALEACNLGPEYEIVRVPAQLPRTKPKALDYALKGARGEFVVIFDAEDRPHPDQLREAYQRFRNRPGRVACLQAPLVISNGQESWISALFALEYAGLFRRLLPLLADAHHPLPLGGTSNHFRMSVLRAIGGWDPYNVTEDADLGLRLARRGYQIEMIARPTIEDAPVDFSTWFGQRTRWFKGWMQTWLVMMRHPTRLYRELGLAGTLMFHMMITGMLVSSLGHPMLIAFIVYFGWNIAPSGEGDAIDAFLFGMDWLNIGLAYLFFGFLGYSSMIEAERRKLGWRWSLVPIYWLALAAAAWAAMIELRFKPFFWKKTPHKPVPPAELAME